MNKYLCIFISFFVTKKVENFVNYFAGSSVNDELDTK